MPRVDRLKVAGTNQPGAAVEYTLEQKLEASDAAPTPRITMRDMLRTITPGQRVRVHGHGREHPIVVTVIMIALDRFSYVQEPAGAPVITNSYSDAGCCPYFTAAGASHWNPTNYVTRMTQRPSPRNQPPPPPTEAVPASGRPSRGRGLDLT